MGLFSCFAFSKASSPQGNLEGNENQSHITQKTALQWCVNLCIQHIDTSMERHLSYGTCLLIALRGADPLLFMLRNNHFLHRVEENDHLCFPAGVHQRTCGKNVVCMADIPWVDTFLHIPIHLLYKHHSHSNHIYTNSEHEQSESENVYIKGMGSAEILRKKKKKA